jgi:hypothetical protein
MRAFLLIFFIFLTHCGYNWGYQNRSLPGGHKTVFVEMFKNQTQTPGIEAYFTDALNRELERSGFVTVTTKDKAELILEGEIIIVNNRGTATINSFLAKDFSNPDPDLRTTRKFPASMFTGYNVQVVTNVKAVRARDDRSIWQTSLNGQQNYRGALLLKQGVRSSNVLYNHSRKKQTIKLVAKDMMNEAFDRLTENF